MTRIRPVTVCAMIALALVSPIASALSLIPRTDNAVGAWDARIGESLWTYQPPQLSGAWFERYPDALVVHAVVFPLDADSFELEFYLNPDTGHPRPVPSTPQALAHSDTGSTDDIVLDNGWKLTGFDPGYDQKLVFENATGQVMWTLDTQTYPHVVDSWRDTVFWAVGYLGDDGIVHAHLAGEPNESWQFDVNVLLPQLSEPLTRPYFRVMGDQLYVGAHEHVFLLDPTDGSVERHWDLVALTGVPWEAGFDEPCFFSGGLNVGTFSQDAQTLIIGFERRIVAIDRLTGALLWHRDPGGFPHSQHPLIHGSTVYVLTKGSAAVETVDAGASNRDPAGREATGCGCHVADLGSRGGVPVFTIVLVATARARKRRGRQNASARSNA